MGDVLQPVHAEIPQLHPSRKGVLDQPPGGVGHDDLPTMGRVGDPRRPVHVDADVVVPTWNPLPGVEAHPDPNGEAGRPVVGGQTPLGGGRGPDGSHRAAEHREERVAHGADLHPAALGDRPANDRGMLVPDSRVPIAELLEQLGGPFDVGEQEGDRPGR